MSQRERDAAEKSLTMSTRLQVSRVYHVLVVVWMHIHNHLMIRHSDGTFATHLCMQLIQFLTVRGKTAGMQYL